MGFFTLSFFWYYFNILAATGIVFFMLAIIYQRSKRIIINTAERPHKPDNSMIKRVFIFAVFAVLFFLAREYKLDKTMYAVGGHIYSWLVWSFNEISGVWNG